MATPRTIPAANPGKRITDFAEWNAALERRDELQAELDAARVDLAAVQDSPGLDEHAAATALLEGGGVAVEAPPTIAELSRRTRILEHAVKGHAQEIDAMAKRLEQQVTNEDERAADDIDAAELLRRLEQVIEIRNRRLARRASIRQRFNGECSLPVHDLQNDIALQLPHLCESFRTGCRHYGVTE